MDQVEPSLQPSPPSRNGAGVFSFDADHSEFSSCSYHGWELQELSFFASTANKADPAPDSALPA